MSAVRAYFDRRYPARDALAAPWFRAGEQARSAIVRPWLAAAAGRRLLDVGTGDGEFLARVLPDGVAAVELVDLSAAQLARAQRAVAGRVCEVTARVGDICTLALRPADIVTAFGVTDYAVDLPRLMHALARLATHLLIVDFARTGMRSAVRRTWLRAHGIALQTPSRAAIRALGGFEIATTRHHHVVRIARRAP